MSSQQDSLKKATAGTGFGDACGLLEGTLRGTFRQEVSTDLITSSSLPPATGVESSVPYAFPRPPHVHRAPTA